MSNTKKILLCSDTLYPSSAPIVLSREADEYATRWNAVWAEATVIPDASRVDIDSDAAGGVDAVPMGGDVQEPGCHTHNSGREKTVQRHNILVLMFGNLFLAIAMIVTFSLELAGAIVYLLAVGFDWVAEKIRQGDSVLAIVYLIFLIVVSALLFADAMILVSGILVQESLALVTFILCFIVGGPCAAVEWHQAVRRSCHLFRWAFRSFHEKWVCQRDMLPRTSSPPPPPSPAYQEQQQQQQQEQQQEQPQQHHQQGIKLPSANATHPVHSSRLDEETIVLKADDILEISY